MKYKDTLFQMESCYSDGTSDLPEIYRIEDLDSSWNMNRRNFLSSTAAVSAMLFIFKPLTLFSQQNKSEKNCFPEIRAALNGIPDMFFFSPDSKRLITRSRYDYCKLWAYNENRVIKRYGSGDTPGVTGLEFSPDGLLMAGVSKTLSIFSSETGEIKTTLEVEGKGSLNYYFSPDSKYLAVARSNARMVHIFSMTDFNKTGTITVGSDLIDPIQIAFTPDSQACIISDSESFRNIIYIISLHEGKKLIEAETPGYCENIKFLADNKSFICCSKTEKYQDSGYVYDIELRNNSGKLVRIIQKPVLDKPEFCYLTPDKRRMFVKDIKDTVTIYSVPEFKVIKRLAYEKNKIINILISPDSNIAAVFMNGSIETNGKSIIELIDLKKGTSAGKINGISWYMDGICFDAAGSAIIGRSMNYSIEFRSVKSGDVTGTISHSSSITYHIEKAFSPDGKIFASSDSDGRIKIYSYPDLKLLTCLYDPQALLNSYAVRQYEMKEADGTVKNGAIPVGKKLPAEAICTCNVVSGKADESKPRAFEPAKKKIESVGSGRGSYCSCNRICTCVPVK